MVDYRFDQIDPVGSFWSGERQGERLGGAIRDGRAYRNGGLDNVEEQAFRTGDMETGMATRRFQDSRTQQAYNWFEQNAPYARNVLRAARNIQDPQRRQQFLQGQRQRFEGMGFKPDQIDGAIAQLINPETAEQAFTEMDSAFSQHRDPNWQLVQTANGRQAASTDPETGHITMGDNTIPGSGAGRYLTPEELAAHGYTSDTVVWQDENGTPHVQQRSHYGRGVGSTGDDEWEAF